LLARSGQMRLIATDVARSVVCVSVCLCVGHTGELCIAAKPIASPFGEGEGLTQVDPRKH